MIVGILQEREKPAPKRLAFSRRFWQAKKWIENI